MKSIVKKSTKLNLNMQTVRSLSETELHAIAGGINKSLNVQSCGFPRPAPSFCV